MNIKSGLDYLLGHFEDNFPRKISTHKTQNKQVLVNSKKDALQHFSNSSFIDCRISAFSETEKLVKKPNLIFVDLDDKSALPESLALFYKTINGIPTVIDTGNGYAIIQPIKMEIWDEQKIGTYNGKHPEELVQIFLSWVERFLTNNKCDSGHHPCLGNTLIRIPGSYNSKSLARGKSFEDSKVSVVCEWNNYRPEVKNLPFKKYVDKIIRKESQRKKTNYKSGEIKYINELLKKQIQNGRKRIFALILCPYFVNVKKLSITESEQKISEYFNNYIPKSLIQYKLREVLKKNILPYSLINMKENDPELYRIVTGDIETSTSIHKIPTIGDFENK